MTRFARQVDEASTLVESCAPRGATAISASERIETDAAVIEESFSFIVNPIPTCGESDGSNAANGQLRPIFRGGVDRDKASEDHPLQSHGALLTA
jgi:hypothetical protein